MANILISYGDIRYYESVKRITRQARKIKFFDKVIAYSEKDLSNELKESSLFQYTRGGGYWLWKPWVILDALRKCNPGDVVYYVDSGCGLNRTSREWRIYDELIQKYSAIFFQYREASTYPGWSIFCSNKDNFSSKIKYWTKPLCRKFLDDYFGDDGYREFFSVWAGACVVKKCEKGLAMVQEWFDIMNANPEIVRDMEGDELNNVPSDFNKHRHDQAILTALVYYREMELNLIVIPETSESQKEMAAIRADRFIQKKMKWIPYVKYRLYNLFHKID